MTETVTPELTQAELVGFITHSVGEVFSMMLGQEVTPMMPFVENSASSPVSGVVSLVGLAGTWAGTGSISCTAITACRLSSMLLMTEYDAINEEVLDAVAELTNMIIGNVKTALEDRLGPMGLSIPTVIFGRNFQTRNGGSHKWIVVPFQCGEDTVLVQLCLSPNQEQAGRPGRPNMQFPPMLAL